MPRRRNASSSSSRQQQVLGGSIITGNSQLILDSNDEEDPTKQYVPLHVDAGYRRTRLIDLAESDVPLVARTLQRMRNFVQDDAAAAVPGRRRPLMRAKLVIAPKDWFEYYSNVRVEVSFFESDIDV